MGLRHDILLFQTLGGLAIDRSITAAVMGRTCARQGQRKIPRTWGVVAVIPGRCEASNYGAQLRT
jgi:hypothetical protein